MRANCEEYPPTEGRCRRQSLEWCRKAPSESNLTSFTHTFGESFTSCAATPVSPNAQVRYAAYSAAVLIFASSFASAEISQPHIYTVKANRSLPLRPITHNYFTARQLCTYFTEGRYALFCRVPTESTVSAVFRLSLSLKNGKRLQHTLLHGILQRKCHESKTGCVDFSFQI